MVSSWIDEAGVARHRSRSAQTRSVTPVWGVDRRLLDSVTIRGNALTLRYYVHVKVRDAR